MKKYFAIGNLVVAFALVFIAQGKAVAADNNYPHQGGGGHTNADGTVSTTGGAGQGGTGSGGTWSQNGSGAWTFAPAGGGGGAAGGGAAGGGGGAAGGGAAGGGGAAAGGGGGRPAGGGPAGGGGGIPNNAPPPGWHAVSDSNGNVTGWTDGKGNSIAAPGNNEKENSDLKDHAAEEEEIANDESNDPDGFYGDNNQGQGPNVPSGGGGSGGGSGGTNCP